MSGLNPLLRHLLFSNMKIGVMKSVKGITLKNGEQAKDLVSISYAVFKDSMKKNVCRTVFSNYTGDVEMTKEESKKFAKSLSIDLDNEFNTYKEFFAKMDFKSKIIYIKKIKINGEVENIEL